MCQSLTILLPAPAGPGGDAILKRLTLRTIVAGYAVAAVALGTAAFVSGMVNGDICHAYETRSVVSKVGTGDVCR